VPARCLIGVAGEFGMPQNFIRGDVDQVFLLPPDVREWLAEDERSRAHQHATNTKRDTGGPGERQEPAG
jgi:hypothetical protein